LTPKDSKDLETKPKKELVEIAKKMSLPYSGTKAAIAERIFKSLSQKRSSPPKQKNE